MNSKNSGKYRLGAGVVPINYSLVFEPIPNFKFKCVESIKVDVRGPAANKIILNAFKLEISSAEVVSNNIKYPAKIKYDEKYGRIILQTSKKIRGAAQINIVFNGENSDELRGFYRSRYSAGKKESYILTSQFEPDTARMAFVCFDQPDLKATFDVSFIIDKDLMAISNMPVKKEKVVNGKKHVAFITTPKMSTYLLYLGVGRFDFIETKYRNIKIRILATPGKREFLYLAREYIIKILHFYENYFGLRYALPKLDLIAVPDFSVGAMENWGAVVFRETSLLGKKDSAIAVKQRIAEVIAHELAHQWFGDLVTMKWWDDLWLNESFADFMETKCLDELFPEWEIGKEIVFKFTTAFGEDSFKATHPVHVKVNSSEQINTLFDPAIAYAKGGSILTMMEDFVTKQVFREGIREYMKKFAYKNAVESDLWDSISSSFSKSAAGKKNKHDIYKIASYWLNNKGYPIVAVSRHGGKFVLSQKRFFLDGSVSGNIWPIPIVYATENGINRIIMDKKQIVLDGSKWIKLNYGQKSYFRSSYDQEDLEYLGALLKQGKLGDVDGYGIVSDLGIMARSGKINANVFFSFIEKYCTDLTDRYPLNVMILSLMNAIYSTSYNYPDTEFYKKVKTDFYGINKNMLDRLGFRESKNERPVMAQLRAQVIKNLGCMNDSVVIGKANKAFSDILLNKKVNENLKSAYLSIIAFNGDRQAYNKILRLYKTTHDPNDKIRFLGALSLFADPKLFPSALDFFFSDDVRLQDKIYIPAISASNLLSRENKAYYLSWLKKNWKAFMKLFNPQIGKLDTMMFSVFFVDDAATRDSLRVFFDRKDNMREDIVKTKYQVFEKIGMNIRFRKANRLE
ncbi:M1 family metallopeptidase [Candidatus Marsarchaeota archaeon]|nr:M1 family metallopeptidase [Candidatus Marsarchaeota archaeon]